MRWTSWILAALVLGLSASAASAQSWPARPVRMVVPYPPGGAADTLGRAVGRKLAEALGQAVIVENRAGAGSVIGTEAVSRADPDGHTVLLTSTPMGTNPALVAKLPYDTLRDFRGVAFVAFAPVVMVAHPSVPAASVTELLALARSRAGGLTVATPGPGSMGHLTLEMLNRQAGIELRHIPYKGAAPALTDLIGGQVNLMFDNVGPARAQIAAGRTRAIGVTALRRSSALPEVPTFHEMGVRGLEAASWFGMFVPAKAPAEVIQRLNLEVNRAVASAELRELYARDGYEASPMTPQGLDDFLRAQIDKWGKLIREAGITPQ
ncbi:MAG: tripartite tricarboxylate transporter substrate binding protein [Betaproteobacteria bacterium]|nr:tripartite tricarboxylate transporter substrate binding protein [Betaproteobacteria bacterium]